jgi:hypothetical protein
LWLRKDKPRTVRILADHNIEGWAILLWQTIATEGWTDLRPMKLLMFSDVGLDVAELKGN